MANVKITELTAITAPATTDVLPIVDVTADTTKKVSVADLLESAGDGAAGTPAFSFASDKDTGIYRPGANQLAVATNGTGRLFVDASGNVGIGTTSPTSLGSGFTEVMIAGNTEGAGLQLQDNNANVKAGIFTSDISNTATLRTITNHPLTFRTNNTEAMRIDGSGLVGIGTSSPSALLHVSSTGAVESLLSGGGTSGDTVLHLKGNGNAYKFIVPNSAAQYGMGLYDVGNAAYRLYVDSSGNVGIGTTSPGKKLTVYGTTTGEEVIEINNTSGSADGATTNAIRVVAGNGTYWANFRYTAYSHIWGFGGNPSISEAARIDSSGRLLVGTSTARSNFDGASPAFQLEGTSQSGGFATIFRNSISVAAPATLGIGRSKGSTLGSVTSLASGDFIGRVSFFGADGTSTINAAEIGAYVDGFPGSNDMPGRLVFSTTQDGSSSPTERFRVTADGSIYFHSTSLPGAGTATTGVGISAGDALSVQRAAATACFFGRSNDGEVVALYSGTTQRGTISIAGATTTYGSISDHRLKENVAPIGNATSRLAQLKPSRFNFVEFPEQEVDGFIAHEVQTVVPEAVIGTKDATGENGEPLYQSVDQSKLVPLLTAALQEAIVKIETLEQRLSDAGIA